MDNTEHNSGGWTPRDMLMALSECHEGFPVDCACDGELRNCFYCGGSGIIETYPYQVWKKMREALGVNVDYIGTA